MVLIVKQERETVGPRNSSTENGNLLSLESIVKSSGASRRKCTLNNACIHHSGVIV